IVPRSAAVCKLPLRKLRGVLVRLATWQSRGQGFNSPQLHQPYRVSGRTRQVVPAQDGLPRRLLDQDPRQESPHRRFSLLGTSPRCFGKRPLKWTKSQRVPSPPTCPSSSPPSSTS